MKKLLTAAAIVGIIGAMTVSCAYAADSDKGYVSVNAKASKEFAPNIARVKFYIETSDKDLSKATQKNKEETKRALDAVKKVLDTAKGDTIQTVNFNVNPEYSYKNNTRTFVQYNITNGFEVKLTDTEKLGSVIAQGLQNGATRVDDLNFSLDNTESACNSLIAQAVGLAKVRANEAAKAAGSYTTGIKALTTSCSGDAGLYPQVRMMNSAKYASGAMTEAVADSAVPTEMGTIKMYATVNAQYFIK